MDWNKGGKERKKEKKKKADGFRKWKEGSITQRKKKKKKQTYFEANQDTRCHNVGVFATGETEGWGLGGS